MDKTHVLQIRLSEYELSKLREMAEALDCSMAEWLRCQIIAGRAVHPKPAPEPRIVYYDFGA